MALALAAQLPALCTAPGGVLVLTSERPLATTRLMEMGAAMLARHPAVANPTLQQLLDHVETSPVADADALEHALSFFLPPLLAARRGTEGSALLGEDVGPPGERSELLRPDLEGEPPGPANGVDGVNAPAPRRRGKPPVRLLVLDSLAALLRAETALTGGGLVARSRRLCSLSDRLKALALEYHLAVVVVNQVSDVFSGTGASDAPEMLYAAQARHFNGQSASVRKEAALGIVWANCVNARLMLARTGRRRLIAPGDVGAADGADGGDSRKRRRTEADGRHPRAAQHAQHAQQQDGDGDRDGEGDGPAGVELADTPALVRRMHQVFSAYGPPGTADFVLARSGLHVLRGSYRVLDLGPALRRRAARSSRAAADGTAAGTGTSTSTSTPGASPEPEPEPEQEAFGLGDLPEDFWDADVAEGDLAAGVVD